MMFAAKVFILLGLTLAIVNAMPSDSIPVLGGVTPFSDLKNAEKALNDSLVKLDAGEGPHYKLGKVYSATKQTVAGDLFKIDADLVGNDGKTKRCNVEIWSRTWLPNGIEVTFKCPDAADLTKKHSA